jgi:hypothetical protein
MALRWVGASDAADLRVEPLAFKGTMEVRAAIPPGPADVDERLACAHFRCQTGGPARTGEDCLVCARYRGWRDGPAPSEITITCGWNEREPVAMRMTCASAVVAVSPEATCAEAELIALAAGVRHMLVVAHGALHGVISLRDLAARAHDPVKRHMRHDVFVLRSDATLGEAAAGMAALRLGCLPVLDIHDVVAGLITRSDLRRAGAPPAILGERFCAGCGATHGVRPDPRDGEEYCQHCIEAFDDLCGPYQGG